MTEPPRGPCIYVLNQHFIQQIIQFINSESKSVPHKIHICSKVPFLAKRKSQQRKDSLSSDFGLQVPVWQGSQKQKKGQFKTIPSPPYQSREKGKAQSRDHKCHEVLDNDQRGQKNWVLQHINMSKVFYEASYRIVCLTGPQNGKKKKNNKISAGTKIGYAQKKKKSRKVAIHQSMATGLCFLGLGIMEIFHTSYISDTHLHIFNNLYNKNIRFLMRKVDFFKVKKIIYKENMVSPSLEKFFS